ncbi:LysR family transcriptional regulator [Brevibacillus marinus]|uniref:LysR family transcriptional regulator n=1 Tax=Brevibacillus marinus TaxID=2496837 RepID=UPI000F82322B|nr:LysR family transcriptional regulator [Brevibacillus marinus]
MDEKDWHLLVTLYHERNITKAAERLYISQPALTYRLQQLEKEFGAKIVTRGKKGVEFTVQGAYLVEYSKEMLLQLRKAKEYILNMEQNVKGTLRLGVSGMFARYELPKLLKNFLAKYPDVEINLKTGWSSEINQLLQKEEVHLGIVRGNYDWHGEAYLFREEMLSIAYNKKIELEELPSLPQIHYRTDPSLRTQIDNWWKEIFRTPPTVAMEVDRIDTCKQLVLNGLGYAIFPNICLSDDEPLYTFPLISSNQQPLLRKTWIIYRESSLELTFVKAFIDFMKEEAAHRSKMNG